MRCTSCGREYVSRYYYVTNSLCHECFEKMSDEEKKEIIRSVESLAKEGAAKRVISGHELTCAVCGNRQFSKRKTLMNTPGLTFLGVEWANKQADNYVCTSCGYVMWFLNE